MYKEITLKGLILTNTVNLKNKKISHGEGKNVNADV